jgi:hypothetical protein
MEYNQTTKIFVTGAGIDIIGDEDESKLVYRPMYVRVSRADGDRMRFNFTPVVSFASIHEFMDRGETLHRSAILTEYIAVGPVLEQYESAKEQLRSQISGIVTPKSKLIV